MVIHNGYENLNLFHPVVTVGVFDGVHLGHRALLDYLASVAGERGGESVVVTFDPHPRLVVSENHKDFFFLTTKDEKKKLMAELHVDHLVLMEFTKDLGNLTAEMFIRDILVNRIGLKHLVLGYDNHFGRKREGDFRKISQYASMFGFSLDQARRFSFHEGIISSSRIREALLKGDLEDANSLLGYDYFMTGIVVEGKKIGRSFGYPTANISLSDKHKLIPANGVYAVEVLVGSKALPGMLSIGYNPTVSAGNGPRTIEVNIFDFDMNLYGHSVTVILRFRLRDEKKFDDIEQLADQMKLDKLNAMKLLKRQ